MVEKIVRKALMSAGVEIGGRRDWDIAVRNDRFYSKVLTQGSLGLGESYMDKDWDAEHLDQFIHRVLISRHIPWFAALNPAAIGTFLKMKLCDIAPRREAFKIGEVHYDLGNDLFEAMLDKSLSYSCGYWKDASTLEQSQEAKLELICRKIGLQPGMKVLDIGCGWGGFAHHAASHYGARVVGITVSKEQASLAQERCRSLPVEIRLSDYRDVGEKFDRIVSVGMFEHVGHRNYWTFFGVAKRALKENGLFLLHTIGSPQGFWNLGDPWIQKYIFPVGEIPTKGQIRRSVGGTWEIRDWHCFGRYYDLTLLAWHERFLVAWPKLRGNYEKKVGGKFFHMWEYYLLACAGAFRAGNIDLWQLVLSRQGEHADYVPSR